MLAEETNQGVRLRFYNNLKLNYKNLLGFKFSNFKNFLRNILRKKLFLFLVSSFLLYILLKDTEFDKIIFSIENANIYLLVFAFSLHAFGLTISAYRWKMLLNSLKVNSNIHYLIKSYLVAIFFNHFIPSTIGGDGSRAYDSYKLGNDKAKGLAVVLVDRLLGLLALLVFVIISIFLSVEISQIIPNIYILLFITTGAAAFIIFFILYPPVKMFYRIKSSKIKLVSKIGSSFFKLGKAFKKFSNKKKILLNALTLSFLLQANVIIYYYIISKALGFDIQIINFSLIIPLTIFITMFPFSINGIGIRENALFFFFSFFGIAKSEAIAFAWIEFGMLLLLGVIGGIVYMFRKTEFKLNPNIQLSKISTK